MTETGVGEGVGRASDTSVGVAIGLGVASGLGVGVGVAGDSCAGLGEVVVVESVDVSTGSCATGVGLGVGSGMGEGVGDGVGVVVGVGRGSGEGLGEGLGEALVSVVGDGSTGWAELQIVVAAQASTFPAIYPVASHSQESRTMHVPFTQHPIGPKLMHSTEVTGTGVGLGGSAGVGVGLGGSTGVGVTSGEGLGV